MTSFYFIITAPLGGGDETKAQADMQLVSIQEDAAAALYALAAVPFFNVGHIRKAPCLPPTLCSRGPIATCLLTFLVTGKSDRQEWKP